MEYDTQKRKALNTAVNHIQTIENTLKMKLIKKKRKRISVQVDKNIDKNMTLYLS